MVQKKIRVLLAEDHRIVREGLIALLRDEDRIEIVGEAENGREAVSMADRLKPDVVVMDILMPQLNGIDATRQIIRNDSSVQVVLLSMLDDREYVSAAVSAGARGYVLKGRGVAELMDAIKAVAEGKAFFSPEVARVVADEIRSGRDSEVDELTDREREILQLVAEGLTTAQIASTLGISYKTVETHRSAIMKKLNVHNLAGLVRYALRKGLVR